MTAFKRCKLRENNSQEEIAVFIMQKYAEIGREVTNLDGKIYTIVGVWDRYSFREKIIGGPCIESANREKH